MTPGVATSSHYQFGLQRFDPAFFTGFGPILPFTLHVGKDFQYPDAFQGNLGIEQMIGKDMSFSASYITVQARHLAHPQDVNTVDTQALVDNFRRFTANNPQACPVNGVPGPCGPTGRAPTSLSEAAFFYSSVPSGTPLYTIVVPGFVSINNTTGQKIVNPIAADYFRQLGPNYFFVQALTGLSKAAFDPLLAGQPSLRRARSILTQTSTRSLSDGNSSYNALNLELKKRFSNNIQFLRHTRGRTRSMIRPTCRRF